jgi:hypothetical protein
MEWSGAGVYMRLNNDVIALLGLITAMTAACKIQGQVEPG